jgi:hypothetical protein
MRYPIPVVALSAAITVVAFPSCRSDDQVRAEAPTPVVKDYTGASRSDADVYAECQRMQRWVDGQFDVWGYTCETEEKYSAAQCYQAALYVPECTRLHVEVLQCTQANWAAPSCFSDPPRRYAFINASCLDLYQELVDCCTFARGPASFGCVGPRESTGGGDGGLEADAQGAAP